MTKSAAVLTVHNAPGMTPGRRLQVARWLRSCAKKLEAGRLERKTRAAPGRDGRDGHSGRATTSGAQSAGFGAGLGASNRFRLTRTLLTLRGRANFSPRGRREIASWLRRCARFVQDHGQELNKRYTARYLY